MATNTSISRYAPGGDIYNRNFDAYGADGAQQIYAAALSGRQGAVAEAIAELKHGTPLPESTAGILAGQLVTDPLGAPLAAANRRLGTLASNTFFSAIKAPWVMALIAIALLVYFWPVVRPVANRLLK